MPFKRNVRRRMSTGRFRRSRFRRRGVRTIASTAQYGRPYGGVQFRTRKMRPRTFRKILWRDTIASSHYRSLGGVTITETGALGTTVGSGIVYCRPAITVEDSFIHTNPFWTTGGGLQILDQGAIASSFRGDLVIRGGIVRFTITNGDPVAADVPPYKVKVWCVWANTNPEATVLNNLQGNSRSLEWDPSIEPDFHDFGKVLFKREVNMLPGAQPFEVSHRLRVQKVDEATFQGVAASPTSLVDPAGSQLWWMWQAIPLAANATADALTVLLNFNLSFSGDVN